MKFGTFNLIFVLLLAGCGGGSGGVPASTQDIACGVTREIVTYPSQYTTRDPNTLDKI